MYSSLSQLKVSELSRVNTTLVSVIEIISAAALTNDLICLSVVWLKVTQHTMIIIYLDTLQKNCNFPHCSGLTFVHISAGATQRFSQIYLQCMLVSTLPIARLIHYYITDYLEPNDMTITQITIELVFYWPHNIWYHTVPPSLACS